MGIGDEKLGWLWEEKSRKHDQRHNFKNTKNNDNLRLIEDTFGGKRTIQYTWIKNERHIHIVCVCVCICICMIYSNLYIYICHLMIYIHIAYIYTHLCMYISYMYV